MFVPNKDRSVGKPFLFKSIIKDNLSDEQKIAGDLNEDNKCNIKDIVAMAKIIAGLITIDQIN